MAAGAKEHVDVLHQHLPAVARLARMPRVGCRKMPFVKKLQVCNATGIACKLVPSSAAAPDADHHLTTQCVERLTLQRDRLRKVFEPAGEKSFTSVMCAWSIIIGSRC